MSLRSLISVFLFIHAFILSGCGDTRLLTSSSSPGMGVSTLDPSNSHQLGADTQAKSSRRLSIKPPTDIFAGQSNPFELWLTDSDGSTKNVTKDSFWLTSNRLIAKASDLKEEAGRISFYRGDTVEVIAFYDNLFDFISVHALTHWEARDSMAFLSFDNRACFLGGWFDTIHRSNEVYCSSDGARWKPMSSSNPWPERNLTRALNLNGETYLFGGLGNSTEAFNDVWKSSDLSEWKNLTNNAEWTPRGAFGAVVFQNKLWLMGGMRYTKDGRIEHSSDIWNSEDGMHWNQVVADAPWGKRAMFDAVVFKDKIWIFGGGEKWAVESLGDIWSSSDGINWTREVAQAPWPARHFLRSIVYHDKVYILAGVNEYGRNLNDVWSSVNGIDWIQENNRAPWGERHEPSAMILNDQLIVVGGAGPENMYNDAWATVDGVTWSELR